MNKLMLIVLLFPFTVAGQCQEFSFVSTLSAGVGKYTPTINLEAGALHVHSGWYAGVGVSMYNPPPKFSLQHANGGVVGADPGIDAQLEPFVKVAYLHKSDGWYQQQVTAWAGMKGDIGASYRALAFWSESVLGGLEGFVSTQKKYGVQAVFLFSIDQYFEHGTFWQKRKVY